MKNKTTELKQIGLSDAEATIYQSLLKLKKANVKDIAKECGFHRTNIYDVLEKLKEKGLVTSHKEGKVVYYQASDPQNLYDFLEEKKQTLDSIFPLLQQLQASSSEKVNVEVFKGNEGMKAVFRDMIRTKKTIYGFGIKGQLREKIPIFAKQIIGQLKREKIKYYAIFTERDNLPEYITEARYVNEKLSGPIATFIYGDKINIQIYEPSLLAIVIHSQEVAKSYKQHFDLLWKAAKK